MKNGSAQIKKNALQSSGLCSCLAKTRISNEFPMITDQFRSYFINRHLQKFVFNVKLSTPVIIIIN